MNQNLINPLNQRMNASNSFQGNQLPTQNVNLMNLLQGANPQQIAQLTQGGNQDQLQPQLLQFLSMFQNFQQQQSGQGQTMNLNNLLQPQNQNQQQQGPKVIFIGDLQEVTGQQIYQQFMIFGDIVSMRYSRRKGFAIIEYKTAPEAQLAKQKMHHEKFLLTPIRVYLKQEKEQLSNNQKANLFVKNLTEQITYDEFENTFGQFGKIKNSKISFDKHGKCIGHGYIQFMDEIAVQNCLKKHEQDPIIIDNQVIEIIKYDTKQLYENQQKNIYIKNLPDNIPLQEIETRLKDVCSSYGKIASMLVKERNGSVFAFICFTKEEDAQNCKQALSAQSPFIDLQLSVEWYQKEASNNIEQIQKQIQQLEKNSKNLFTKNLKQSVTSDELVQAYQAYGNIIKWIVSKPQGSSTTQYGMIEFENLESAQKALQEAEKNPVILDLYENENIMLTPWIQNKLRQQLQLKQGKSKISFINHEQIKKPTYFPEEQDSLNQHLLGNASKTSPPHNTAFKPPQQQQLPEQEGFLNAHFFPNNLQQQQQPPMSIKQQLQQKQQMPQFMAQQPIQNQPEKQQIPQMQQFLNQHLMQDKPQQPFNNLAQQFGHQDQVQQQFGNQNLPQQLLGNQAKLLQQLGNQQQQFGSQFQPQNQPQIQQQQQQQQFGNQIQLSKQFINPKQQQQQQSSQQQFGNNQQQQFFGNLPKQFGNSLQQQFGNAPQQQFKNSQQATKPMPGMPLPQQQLQQQQQFLQNTMQMQQGMQQGIGSNLLNINAIQKQIQQQQLQMQLGMQQHQIHQSQKQQILNQEQNQDNLDNIHQVQNDPIYTDNPQARTVIGNQMMILMKQFTKIIPEKLHGKIVGMLLDPDVYKIEELHQLMQNMNEFQELVTDAMHQLNSLEQNELNNQ